MNFICETGPHAQKISKSNLYIELENKSLEMKSILFNSALNESKVYSQHNSKESLEQSHTTYLSSSQKSLLQNDQRKYATANRFNNNHNEGVQKFVTSPLANH